jgi:decaprenylphospho-beta-D-ribofuranose 2-oxidase
MIETMSGWGRYPRVPSDVLRPSGTAAMRAAVLDHGRVIARGNGRAYGDAGIGATATVLSANLDHVLAFDPETGLVTVEAGMGLDDLIATFLPRGWFPPVVPGTRFPSVGGLIASDVHGKNHHRDGSFGDHVEALTLMTASGAVLQLSRTSEPDLFFATTGGMGLTGVILDATFRLIPVETGMIRQTNIVCGNLRAAMDALEAANAAHYTVAWIDCSATGADLGRSLIFLGEHASAADVGAAATQTSLRPEQRQSLAVPFDMPGIALNRLTIGAFNALYFRKGAARAGASFLVDHQPYFFPLDAIARWNRIYGGRGFVQHQCVIPEANAEDALAEIVARVAARGTASPLAVLKKLGQSHGLLSFPMPGYTLALDFAVSDDLLNFLGELDAIVLNAGGRLYLAKDARQSRNVFEAGYPGLDAFRAIRRRIDPDGKFASHLSQRLGI